ncbi:Hereditary spastic paraplegia protein strumpellin, putative [Leishmania donovani]|uniref:Hereditary spastic paraplegia protein strumpellin, putative n=1 Tax=Leishmania donovani TaxID=5661 RepID=A0A3Q8IHP0_LEIDO|nr:Hereditary spastic paraplegia protein strumpellin, putative [Leishmania donovani]
MVHRSRATADTSSDHEERVNFLDDDCGRNALQLAARGSTIVATLQRLAAHIPAEFTAPSGTPYARLIFDFRYFKHQDQIEKSIADSAELLVLDKEFYDTHMELLEKFMSLFRGIYGYVIELNRYVRKIQDGQYVAQTLDTVLESLDGRQLLCELYHLYGVMLLLMDHKIGGLVRERIIVSYVRYRGSGEAHTVEVAELCRATSQGAGGTAAIAGSPVKRAPVSPRAAAGSGTGISNYPIDYFERVPVQKGVVARLLACIRSDDIYRMSSHYPNPDHRSAAMALQGGIAFVLLFFCGDVLVQQLPVMKELVEKHFADNWVVHYYGGYTADLSVAWAAFPAARAALQRTLESHSVTYHLQRMRGALARSTERVQAVLEEGMLTENYVLDNVHASLLPIITESNVVLRWFVLQGVCSASASSPPASPVCGDPDEASLRAAASAAGQAVRASFENDELLTLLLATAQLERHVHSRFAVVLQEKTARWTGARRQAVSRVQKLSHFFSEDNLLDTSVHDAELERWFAEVGARIANLHMKRQSAKATRRKLQRLVAALENIQEFAQVNQQLQVLQYVRETCADLHQMLHYLNAERRVLGRLATVTDFSYAWELLSAHGYLVRELQARIRRQPVVAAHMQALFAKLSSLLHLPCIRIDEGIAVTAASVLGVDVRLERALQFTSTFYSEEVVSFLRSVLQVIPTSIFEVLNKVMYLLTNALRECPSKLQRDEWKHWSQLETREQLCACTADIARYAAGLLAMEETTVGVVRVNPHRLLEDGIRKELVEHITRELHAGIWFDRSKPSTVEDLDKELVQLGARLRGVRNSFEYIQDFVNVHGLKIWMEEFQRIVRFTLQMECNAFWPKKVYPWSSPYQSASITIPYFAPASPKDAYSFLGHLVQHLLYLTDPRESIYFPAYGAWFTRRRLCECVGPRLFSRVADAVDCTGLACLDELLSSIAAKDMQLLVQRLAESVASLESAQRGAAQEVWARCMPTSGTPEKDAFLKDYDQLASILEASPAAQEVGVVAMRLGRIALIRQLIAHQLRSDSKQDSSALVACVQAVNNAVVATLDSHLAKDPFEARAAGPSRSCAEVSEGLVCGTAPLLRSVGLTDPFATVYDVADGGGGVSPSGDNTTGEFSFGAPPPAAATAGSGAARPVAVPTKLPLPLFVLPLCVVVLLHVQKCTYSPRFDSCIPAGKEDDVDPTMLAVGVVTLLQQFPLEATRLLLQLLAQVVRVSIIARTPTPKGKGKGAAPPLVCRCADALTMWIEVLQGYLPRYPEKERSHGVPPSVPDRFAQSV